jgi:monofunctional biosynthetic peptidoglycan transglycosylase
VTASPNPQPKPPRRKISLLSVLKWLAITVVGCWLLAGLTLIVFKWIDPPTTAVHMERRVEAWIHHKPYRLRYQFVPLSQISPNLQHAAIAAEDERFYQHHGFDWHAMELAAEEDEKGGHRLRGGSTITQQLVKNLLLGTSRSYLRKGAEFTLVPVAELVLGKQRILELYLNEVELGPGICGVEAASRTYYGTSARKINRDEAARLAAVLPLPLKRRPERMDHYSEIILEHMGQMGW